MTTSILGNMMRKLTIKIFMYIIVLMKIKKKPSDRDKFVDI